MGSGKRKLHKEDTIWSACFKLTRVPTEMKIGLDIDGGQ